MVRVEEPRARKAAQLVTSICEALGSVSTTHTRHGGAFLQSSPGAVEVGGLEAESYHQLSREFKASLSTGYPVSQGERGIKEITGGKGLAPTTRQSNIDSFLLMQCFGAFPPTPPPGSLP